jgi:endonuclease/exonuclease/phosphatase (EEP) superfamily protein YafD
MVQAQAVLLAAPAAFAVIVATALIFRSAWPFEILFNLAPQLALFGVVAALMMLGLGRPVSAAAFALTAAACVLVVRELFGATPTVARPDVTIVWHNAFGSKRSFSIAARIAEKEGASAFAATEYPGDSAVSDAVRRAFPHQFPTEVANGGGPVIFSRTPFLWTDRTAEKRRPRIEVGLSAPGGPLRIVAVHAPVTWSSALSTRQRTIIREAVAKAGSGPRTLLIGDFNTTRWSDPIGGPLRATPRLRHLSLGLGTTWLAPAAFLGVPIDHAFVTDDLEAAAGVGPATGSDHRPIIVRLRTQQTSKG